MERAESGVIATTPPITRNMEEQLSQSSSPGSGTHLSNMSGFSLGEAIVQRAKQGTELWPQLQSETDIGELTSATASRLLLTGAECTQALEEFPTMEEGTITITEELRSPQGEFGQFQTPQVFELQESDLSPALALVTACSMQNLEGNLSQSFFHRSPLEFAPLRAAPDLSMVSCKGCPGALQANNFLQSLISEVSGDHVKGSLSLSRHPSQDSSDAWVLSQHPLTPPTPGSEDEEFSRAESYIQDQRFMELPSRPLGHELHCVPFPDHGALLDRELPSHLCSEQMDLPSNSGSQTEGNHQPSSNWSSSQPESGAVICGTVLPKEEDGQRAADQQCSNAGDRRTFPEPLQDPGNPESAITIPNQCQPADEVGQASCPDSSQEPSTTSGPDVSSNSHSVGTGLVTSSTESLTPNDSKDDTAIEVLPSGSGKGDSTGTEQEHKDGQLSPAACPPSHTDSSFTPPVDGPICQSTPAIVMTKVPDPSGQGRRAAGHQSSSTGLCRFPLAPAFVKLESDRASQEPTSAGTRQPSLGTTWSLPALSNMEKVGAWNPGGWPSFDSLVLHGLRGVSPRQRAYSAIADSLNHMLARGPNPLPKRSIAAAFGAAPRPEAGLQSVQTSVGKGSCLQTDTGRGSPDRASPCKPDSSPHVPKGDRGSSAGPTGSGSAHSESLQLSCSAASLSPLDIPPDPKPSDGQEKDSVDQSFNPPGPGPLITTHTYQFDMASTDDGINPQASSLDTSRTGEHTLTTSGHSLTSLEVDNYVPVWAPSSLTPESNHFNIDDRIPVYLQNLGISQSPTSILGSRGLLREVEFNPSERKRVREAATEGFQAEEGVSALDCDSGCTFYSDVLTHSTSIPLGSETGRNTPDPSELSLGTAERRGLEPAVILCPSGYSPTNNVSTQLPAQALGDSLGKYRVLTPPFPGRMLIHDSGSVSRRAGLSLGRLGSVPNSDACDSALFCSSPSGKGAGGRLEPSLHSPGVYRPPHLCCDETPQRSDSFVGSETLSEIRKLLGEAGASSALWSELYFRTLDSGQDEAAKPAGDEGQELLRQQDRSEPVAERLETEAEAADVQRPSSRDGGDALRSLLAEGESRVRTAARGRLMQPVNRAGRVEPEGCSGATAGGVLPSPDPASPKPTALADGQAVPRLPCQPRQAWAHTSGPESGESTDNSSHVDLPGAPVTSPLRVGCPAGPTMDPSAQGWERTKWSLQPLDPLSMLDEEDRRKIEEIKAELLQKSKTSISPQGAWSAETGDLSPTSSADTGWPARPLTTFLSLNTASSQIYTQLQNLSEKRFESRVQLRTSVGWDMDSLLEAVDAGPPATDCSQSARPITAITFSSCRRPPSASHPPTTPLLAPPPADHEEPPAHLLEAEVPGAEPTQSPKPTVNVEEAQCPQSDWGQGDQRAAKPSVMGQSLAEVVLEAPDPDPVPLRSPTRTVMSHVRVTLSPNRPNTSTVCSGRPPSPSGNPLFLARDGQWTGRDSGLQPSPPAHHPALGTACNGPPYPPVPMPVPAFCPTFPPLFDHASEAKFPSTGQPFGQDGLEVRTRTAQDGSKVDVSTQTCGPAPTLPAGSSPKQRQGQDLAAQTERTPSILAPVTGGTTAVSGRASTTDVPLMLPYKPSGSSKLFYVPSSGTRRRFGLVDSENSSETYRADSRDIPPPSLPSQVPPPRGYTTLSKGTAHRDSRKAATSNVTRGKEERGARHHQSPHTQGAGGFASLKRRDLGGGGAHPGLEPRVRSAPGTGSRRPWRHPEERQREAGSRREAWLGSWEQEGELRLSYKERAKAAARSGRGQPAPETGTDPGDGRGQPAPETGADPGDGPRSALDELWERFKQRQRRQCSLSSSTASELSLLQRLDRLAQFLRNPPLPPHRPDTPSSASLAEISTDRIRDLLEQWRDTDTGSSPADGILASPVDSSGPVDSASTASTIDTARLIRAFGPERVLPLSRLYSAIQQQKESSAHRRERQRRGETRCPGAPVSQQVSTPQALTVSSTTSDSARRPSARPTRRPTSRLVNKKGTRLVNQGVQAGSLEIVPGATRRQTRDVGVTFPSPDSEVTLHQLVGHWDCSASPSKQPATGPRDRRRKGVSQTDRRPRKGSRAPAVAWYIPAHELQGDWRKENVPVPRHRPVHSWAQREPVSGLWREPLRQKHVQEHWACEEGGSWAPPPAPEQGIREQSPSTLVPLTLRERVRRLALLTEERKLQSILQSERDRLFNQPPSRGFRDQKGRQPDNSVLYKKKISKQEMLDRSKRLYEQLPEVVRRKEEEKRKTEYQTNRLRAQLYKQVGPVTLGTTPEPQLSPSQERMTVPHCRTHPSSVLTASAVRVVVASSHELVG
ncbi:uncharacterized protein alms1 isoform X2 [Pristis pectinata]|uniref:uncharacterized protein alms1 isoform X2 n=1 Tax=Pristis pectinata TaxID=685728 RepID=UPI00223D043A|nr:uncharacterized protein alms1 isoform X2 [Pristis pectinata]